LWRRSSAYGRRVKRPRHSELNERLHQQGPSGCDYSKAPDRRDRECSCNACGEKPLRARSERTRCWLAYVRTARANRHQPDSRQRNSCEFNSRRHLLGLKAGDGPRYPSRRQHDQCDRGQPEERGNGHECSTGQCTLSTCIKSRELGTSEYVTTTALIDVITLGTISAATNASTVMPAPKKTSGTNWRPASTARWQPTSLVGNLGSLPSSALWLRPLHFGLRLRQGPLLTLGFNAPEGAMDRRAELRPTYSTRSDNNRNR